MTYNILEGLRDPSSLKLSLERLGWFREFLDEMRPDILILNEANWCEPSLICREQLVFNYRVELGYPHGVASLYDYEWGNVILSRLPIEVRWKRHLGHRQSVGVLIEIADGKRIGIETYHPFPYYPGKIEAFKKIIEAFERDWPNLPHIIAGDFNSISPEDGVDAGDFMTRLIGAGFSQAEQIIQGMIADSGIPALVEAGYVDLVPAYGRRNTIPTPLRYSADTGARIDHIFGRGVRARYGGVHVDYFTDMISDHYPVWVDFELSPITDNPGGDKQE